VDLVIDNNGCNLKSVYLIKKNNLIGIFSWLILAATILLILPSGFRGDIGPDSETYRIMYDQAEVSQGYLYFSDQYGFEPASSSIMMLMKRSSASYEDVQFAIAFFSIVCLLLVFFNSSSINFIIFSLIYLTFCYYQLQWSVIRNCLAFWIFSAAYVFFRKTVIAGVASGLFHYSFFISLFRIKIFYLLLGMGGFPFLLFYYVSKYGAIEDVDMLLSIFWGGWGRFTYHLVVGIILLFLMGLWGVKFKKNIFVAHSRREEHKLTFILLFFSGMLFPLGWRFIAVSIPFILGLNFQSLSLRRVFILISFLGFLFIQKSYSFAVTEISKGMDPVIFFIRDFYGLG